jgi:FKBP-type peptidyl-prolyl cis-trans isomerase
MKIIMKFMILVLMIVMFSCTKNDDNDQEHLDDVKIQEYLTQNNITATKDSWGFYYEKLSENTNGQKVESGKIVALRYKISTLDGKPLEDLIDKDSTVLFQQGTGNILPMGLDEGVGFMRTHEKYRFYIPSYLAYGDYSNSSYFPSYTNFIVEAIVDSVFSESDRFEMERDSIESYLIKNNITTEKYASGLYYSEVVHGTGDSPTNGYHVEFNYTRKNLAGKVLYTTVGGESATIVMGGPERAVRGLEEGLRQMHEGGKAILYMTSELGLGASVRVLPSSLMNDLFDQGYLQTDVFPYEPLIYEVELIDVYW